MMKVNIGFFGDEHEAEKRTNERLIKAAKALGCVTDEEISDGVACLKRIAHIETRYTFDDVGNLEHKMYVLALRDY